MTAGGSLYPRASSSFSIAPGRSGTRRRMLDVLRPEGALIPLEIDLVDVMAELDPGMVDWRDAGRGLDIAQAHPGSCSE